MKATATCDTKAKTSDVKVNAQTKEKLPEVVKESQGFILYYKNNAKTRFEQVTYVENSRFYVIFTSV